MSELRPVKNYIPSLDGLRAFSIILVIFYHANLFLGTPFENSLISSLLSTGNIGVSCFFVLSGYLISGILLDTREHPKYYRNFFFRRALRIFPLYYLVLFVAFIVLPEVNHPNLEKWSSTDSTWYWLYLSNFYIAAMGKFNHGLVDLSWSLSIEEQFYLVWPWVVLWLRPAKLKYACYVGILISLVARLYFGFKGDSGIQAYVLTYCRLDGLLLGSLLALEKRKILSLDTFMKHRWKLFIFFLCLTYIFKYTSLNSSPFYLMINYLAVAIVFTSLLSLTIEKNYKIFSQPALISIGKYSYGIYLIHYPVQAVLKQVYFTKVTEGLSIYGVSLYQVLFILLVTGISYLLSFIVFQLYENQFLKLKKYFSY